MLRELREGQMGGGAAELGPQRPGMLGGRGGHRQRQRRPGLAGTQTEEEGVMGGGLRQADGAWIAGGPPEDRWGAWV